MVPKNGWFINSNSPIHRFLISPIHRFNHFNHLQHFKHFRISANSSKSTKSRCSMSTIIFLPYSAGISTDFPQIGQNAKKGDPRNSRNFLQKLWKRIQPICRNKQIDLSYLWRKNPFKFFLWGVFCLFNAWIKGFWKRCFKNISIWQRILIFGFQIGAAAFYGIKNN